MSALLLAPIRTLHQVCISFQSDRRIRIFMSNHIAVFGLYRILISCTNRSLVLGLDFFQQILTRETERALCVYIEKCWFFCDFNAYFTRFLRKMRYCRTDERHQITQSKRIIHAVKIVDGYSRKMEFSALQHDHGYFSFSMRVCKTYFEKIELNIA